MNRNKFIAELTGTFWLVFGGWALAQLWLFWVAPIGGALVAGLAHRWIEKRPGTPAD